MITNVKRRSVGGFTLVELLVVIGIISILVAVSFPYIKSSLAKANMVKCSGNLRSIGVAMISFAGDNNGNLPESANEGAIVYNATSSVTGQYGWTQQLQPYVGTSPTVFQCPEGMNLSGNASYSYFNGAHAGYSASGGSDAAVSLIKCHDLSRHIISGDIAFPSVYGSGLTDTDKSDYTVDPAFNGGTATAPTTIPIHLGNSNILFGDGHVESAKYFDPTTMTTVYAGVNGNTSYLNP